LICVLSPSAVAVLSKSLIPAWPYSI
jgi:hypothetical protein